MEGPATLKHKWWCRGNLILVQEVLEERLLEAQPIQLEAAVALRRKQVEMAEMLPVVEVAVQIIINGLDGNTPGSGGGSERAAVQTDQEERWKWSNRNYPASSYCMPVLVMVLRTTNVWRD
jgi:hypothetical protein